MTSAMYSESSHHTRLVDMSIYRLISESPLTLTWNKFLLNCQKVYLLVQNEVFFINIIDKAGEASICITFSLKEL